MQTVAFQHWGAWADYAAAFQKRRQELAAAKASGTAVNLSHGPPNLLPHLPGPPYPRPTPYLHSVAPSTAPLPLAPQPGSISTTIADAMTAAADLLDTTAEPSGRPSQPHVAANGPLPHAEDGIGTATLNAGERRKGISGRCTCGSQRCSGNQWCSCWVPAFLSQCFRA